MQAGRLRHRVEFLEPTSVEEANGSERTDYELAFTRWASVEPIKGAEALRANQPLAVMDTRIVVRWSENVDRVSEKWRARHRGVTYSIESIANSRMADRDVEVMCKSGAV